MHPIGISSCAYALTDENFEALKQSGVDAAEVALKLDGQLALDCKEVAALAARHGIRLWSYHLPFSPFRIIDISSTDAEVRKYTLDTLTGLIQKAADAGLDKFVIHASGEPIEDAQREERIKHSMESLDYLAELAAREGAVIAVEDLPRTCLGNTAKELLRLISVNDKLRVCFDTNHLLKEDNVGFVEAVGEKIITLHVSDYDFIDEKHWLPGEGLNDWNAIFAALQKVGYKGAWMYELGRKAPASMPRSRDLTFEDFVRNAREIFAGAPLTRIE